MLPLICCLSLWVGAQPLVSSPSPTVAAGGLAAVPASGPTLSHSGGSSISPGQILTVEVRGVGSDVKFASFDLGPSIHGLQLFPVGEGRWTGQFVVLPSMAGRTLQPQARLYDGARQEVSVSSQKDGFIKVAASQDVQAGVIATTHGRTAVAFDATIRMDTLTVQSAHDSVAFRPEIKNNYMLLPKSIKSADIVSVSALTITGEKLVLSGPAASSLAMGTR